jgi:uncharacterized iron-regulated membrane protein
MTRGTIRGWYLVHKWTSLVCTLFLLMLCLTGLPLIFHDEIDAALGEPTVAGPASASAAPGLVPLDRLLATTLAARRGEVPLYMGFSNDGPVTTVTTGPTPTADADRMTMRTLDRVTGATAASTGFGADQGVMALLLQIHIDMLAGRWGMYFLGAMGALFVVALVSGTVLYAPFTRKLDFGTMRTGRSRRLAWLDAHNLVGIAALAWMTVVGTTGIINTLATPIQQAWQAGELAEMTRADAGRSALSPRRYTSLDKAMLAARAAFPGMNPQFVAFPGTAFSSRHHYAIFFQGATPLTQHLLSVALVDAETGALTDARAMPWYVRALSLSRPLHFGDYGGLPMKLLWAALDLFTILVLGSGLVLWLGRRRAPLAARLRELESGGRIAAPVPAE